MSPRILVTGAGGFVGTYLVAALAKHWPAARIVGVGLPPARAVDMRDPADVDTIVAEERPEIIVHLAAQASVGAIEQGSEEQAWRVNLGGTMNLALAVTRFVPHATVLFASSSEIYGRAFGPDPIDEATIPQPANVYAKTKILAERVLDDVLPKTARLIVARPFNHTGAGQREDFVLPSFAGQIARIEAGQQAPVIHVGNLNAARDFLDVRDVVEAYCKLIARAPELGSRTTFNIASGTARPIRDLLEIMRHASKTPFEITIDPSRLRPSDIPIACGDASRLRALTNWHPSVPIQTTLRDLLDAARRARPQDV